jgi:hypothetical protein
LEIARPIPNPYFLSKEEKYLKRCYFYSSFMPIPVSFTINFKQFLKKGSGVILTLIPPFCVNLRELEIKFIKTYIILTKSLKRKE